MAIHICEILRCKMPIQLCLFYSFTVQIPYLLFQQIRNLCLFRQRSIHPVIELLIWWTHWWTFVRIQIVIVTEVMRRLLIHFPQFTWKKMVSSAWNNTLFLFRGCGNIHIFKLRDYKLKSFLKWNIEFPSFFTDYA